jgi:uncharacterized coiled-coil DUF342 family protein
MGIIEIGQEIDSLTAEKGRLIDRIKKVREEARGIGAQIAKRVAVLKKTGHSPSSHLRAGIESIEFEIATSAFTPKREKELIKEIAALQKQLSAAKKSDALQAEVDAYRSKFNALKNEYDSLDKQIGEAKAKIEALFAGAKKEMDESAAKKKGAALAAESKRRANEYQRRENDYRRQKADFRKKERDEMAPYLKKNDEFLTLEDKIIEIKRKDKAE